MNLELAPTPAHNVTTNGLNWPAVLCDHDSLCQATSDRSPLYGNLTVSAQTTVHLV